MEKDIIFQDIINDLKFNKTVLKMKKFIQHGSTNCYEHCMNVAYYSYLIAKKHKLDYKAVARAALLHDLFLYDWHHHTNNKNIFQMHGFVHPKKSYINASKITKLNDKEKDIIVKHMWPLTLKLPKYKETWIIILIDKICSINEFLQFQAIKRKYIKLSNIISTLLIAIILKL